MWYIADVCEVCSEEGEVEVQAASVDAEEVLWNKPATRCVYIRWCPHAIYRL